MVYENGVTYIQPAYKLEINPGERKPTNLHDATFNTAQFIAGLEFDDSLSDSQFPMVGNLMGIVIGGITSFNESWESLYIDVNYYKEPTTGQKQAVVECGESKYCELFENWIAFNIPKSMKSVRSIWSGAGAFEAALWEHNVNELAKKQYGIYAGVTPNEDYKYDIEFTFDIRRRTDNYVSYLFLDDKGAMYEYAKSYNTEKIEIVVTKPGILGIGDEVKARLNILPMLNPVTKLPDDKAALFNIMIP